MLDIASYSDIGSREVNEDALSVYQRDGKSLFVLCDGLGGHGMGDLASQLVVSVFGSQFLNQTDPAGFLGPAFQASQDILTAEQMRLSAGQRMKTTAVALLTDEKRAYIGHVGDSRLYVFGKKGILKRTLDHSIPQMLALTGEITEEEIRGHSSRNTLLRVLGVEWEAPMYELMPSIPLRKCKGFLLASDGFWELIHEEAMWASFIQARSAEEWLAMMRSEVFANGLGRNMDNNSAIAVMNR